MHYDNFADNLNIVLQLSFAPVLEEDLRKMSLNALAACGQRGCRSCSSALGSGTMVSHQLSHLSHLNYSLLAHVISFRCCILNISKSRIFNRYSTISFPFFLSSQSWSLCFCFWHAPVMTAYSMLYHLVRCAMYCGCSQGSSAVFVFLPCVQ